LVSGRSESEKAIYFMIPTMWHSGEGKTMEGNKKIRDCQGLGMGGWVGNAQGIFRVVELFCTTL